MKVILDEVSKQYGKVEAVKRLDLEIRDSEFLTLVGPSGCGKTTTLRMIAGLISPSSGRISFDDEMVADPARGILLPAESRQLGMVFQSYALWPHLTVYRNCSLGLEARGLPERRIREQVEEALDLVGLAAHAGRYPHELSGGQQQRVALARAIALKPRLLLFDEPLSNLDAALREQMCEEIRDVQRRLAITAVYVTHNQAESMVLSDRIGVMHEGALIQIGMPQEVYRRPRTKFVAGFFGKANLLAGHAEHGGLRVGRQLLTLSEPVPEGPATAFIRPEAVRLQQTGPNQLSGLLRKSTFLGNLVEHEITVEALAATVIVQTLSNALLFQPRVTIALPPEDLVVLAA